MNNSPASAQTDDMPDHRPLFPVHSHEVEDPVEIVRFAGYVFARSAEGPWDLVDVEATHL